MMNGDEIDLIAAEYVLGTLPADERAAAALRSREDIEQVNGEADGAADGQ